MALFDLARMTVSSSGTGTITLNAAVSGFITFDAAGCSTAATGQDVTYAIGDTTQSEIGSGTYRSSSLTLTRGPVHSTNSNNAINMSNAAQVFITPQAKGIIGRIVAQTFSANGTYTPTTGLIVAVIDCVGGGGGGGGCDGFAGAVLGGGGGGGGSFSRGVVVSSAIGASQAVTVGAGGSGGAASTNGSSGGTTSVGSLVVAPGGSGGTAVGNLIAPTGGAGGVAGTGNMTTVVGGTGGFGFYDVNLSPTHVFAPTGKGGDSGIGAGAASATIGTDGSTPSKVNGNAAIVGGGGGGSGAGTWNLEDVATGGAGADGGVLITEYCSL